MAFNPNTYTDPKKAQAFFESGIPEKDIGKFIELQNNTMLQEDFLVLKIYLNQPLLVMVVLGF